MAAEWNLQPQVVMAEQDYEEPDLSAEDPELTPQNRWRSLLPLLLLVLIPLAGIYALSETTGHALWPSHNALLQGDATVERGAVGTAGRFPTAPPPESGTVIRELGTITGLADRHPLIGQRVTLQVPVAGMANDRAFWVGDKDHRLLVVPSRDRRTSAQKQEGLIAPNQIAPIEGGQTAEISGTIQKLPRAEEMFSWELGDGEYRAAAVAGVYLKADRITAQ